MFSGLKRSTSIKFARRVRRGPRGFRALLRCAGTPRARLASGPPRLGGCNEDQLRHPDQLVGGHDVLALGMGTVDSEVRALAEAAGGLGPAEHLLDVLAALLVDGVGEGKQDLKRLVAVLAGRIRHNALFAEAADGLLRVVSLVASDRPEAKSRFCSSVTWSTATADSGAPTAGVTSNSTHRPLRLSIAAWPAKDSRAL